MCGTEDRIGQGRIQLPHVGAAAAGCSCCTPAGSVSVSTAASLATVGPPTVGPAAPGTPDGGIPAGGGAAVGQSQFALEGLTCGHCVQTVEKAVSVLPGVEDVSVDLVAGGRSRLVVAGAVDASAVQQAVTSAGYTFIPSAAALKGES